MYLDAIKNVEDIKKTKIENDNMTVTRKRQTKLVKQPSV